MNQYNHNNVNQHLPRALPTDDAAAFGVQSTTSTASIPYTEDFIAHAHRRNHSSDHIIFPKFPVPPPNPETSTTSAQGNNSTSAQASEPHHAVVNLQSRSSSMPSTAGHRLSTGKDKDRETYTLADRTSTLLQVTGLIPPPLIGSTTIIHNKRMILFGGRREGGAPTNDLYVLDLDTLVWELVDHAYHQRHAAAQQNDPSTTPSSLEERRHPLSPDNTQRIGESVVGLTSLAAYTTSIPKPRYYHSAVVVAAPPLFDAHGVLAGWGEENTAQMIVFGGRCFEEDVYGVHEACLNDTHMLDLTSLRWLSTCLNPADFQHSAAQAGQQQRTVYETSGFLDPTKPLRGLNLGSSEMSENAKADKLGNFGSVDSGHGSMEPSRLAASLAALTPADMSFQAAQFSQSRRETPPLRSPTPSTSIGTSSSITGTPLTTQQPTPQSVHSPFLQHTPRARFAHVASLNGDHMVIVGGRAQDNSPIQEISVLDLARRVWMMGGDFHAQCCQRMSALAGVEERPMTRRRRRYLECLAGDQQSLEQSTTSSAYSSSSLSYLSPSSTPYNSAPLPRLPSAAIPPISPTSTSFLLNPRKNSWHRGEGHPFDLLPVNSIPRHRFKSDSRLLTGLEQDDGVWGLQPGKPQDPTSPNMAKSHGLVGLGMDPEISQGMAASAGLSMSTEDAVARARQPSVSSSKSSQTTTSKGSKMSAQEAARKRSQSQSSSSPSHSSAPSVAGSSSRSRSKAPVHHAVNKKFFAKSNGGMMDLDDLASTIAREAKARPPQRPKVIATTRAHRRGSASTTSSSGSIRRGSAATDDSRKTGKTDGKSEKSNFNNSRGNINDSRSNINDSKSNINDNRANVNATTNDGRSNVIESKSNVNDPKTEKRKSLGNLPDPLAFSGIILADTMESSEQAAATASQKLLRPSLYLYSNYTDTTSKPRQEILKVQATKTATCARSELNSYDIKAEWTGAYVSDLATRMLASTELAVPPQMLFPENHVVDHCVLVSGSAALSTTTTTSVTRAAGNPTSGPSSSAESLGQEMHDGASSSSSASGTDSRSTFSVWMFHLKTHQWTQLELSKSLSCGEWKQSVLDRDDNYLYLIGTGIKDFQQELAGLDSARQLASTLTPTAFTHLVKVDLEGFGICPEIDEASMGTDGAKLGLVMLRDGLGADVVLVSSADGCRVRVNSAMVGQRWGYFQNLIKERESKIKHDSTYIHGPRDEDARLQEMTDLPAEIVVREAMPILVAFLQYVYTNELATAHQLKLKSLQGMLLMSRRYDLTRLRQLVLRELHHQLDANNAPAICEVAVLSGEFGLQTCALRVLLQNARLAQLRQQGEAAEAKRRLDFAMSRLEEIEEERRRRASVPGNHPLHGAAAAAASAAAAAASSAASGGTGPGSGPGIPRSRTGSSAMFTGGVAPLRSGSGPSSTTASNTSTPGLSSIGRFFRHREESVELDHH
ncbi:hypothetical protein BGZ96_000687 [Linnemannia gamsii]|uniref:BTB domain-containing protein n=1 Tax=Linnemannia gamsii TaxID=64522 RepID=A0ABQ7KHK6_9FUNG|nr:hypothetical protein BGZ96_000687 [Linnemannia gamsii]